MYMRVGLIKGLQFLSQHFQIIIYNNHTSDLTDASHKEGAEKIKALLTFHSI